MAVSYQTNRNVQGDMTHVEGTVFPASRLEQDAFAAFKTQVRLFESAVLMGEASVLEDASIEGQAVQVALSQLEQLPDQDQALAEASAALRQAHVAYSKDALVVYAAIAAGNMDDEITRKAGELGEQKTALENQFKVFTGNVRDYTTDKLNALMRFSSLLQKISGVMFVVVLLLTFIVGGYVLRRLIVTPINLVINRLRDNSVQVQGESQNVAKASQQMAQGTSQQASSLEETSASLEEMASMTKQNADHASNADKLMKEVKQAIEQSMKAMQRMIGEINNIRESANQTAKIIKTIDEIAFQTNLLALNAAVEAARAGEAGKGFAVVAEEVRNLAQRSAEAARNTADLIEGSQKNAESGVNVTEELSREMTSVAEAAEKVAALVAEIDAASQEQARGVDQLNTAVAEMDHVVQQNAANAEESASASEELSSQARELNAMVVELINLVGGQLDADARSSGKAGKLEAVVSHKSRKQLENAAHTKEIPEKTRGTGNKALPDAKTPEEMIPLEDQDVEDF